MEPTPSVNQGFATSPKSWVLPPKSSTGSRKYLVIIIVVLVSAIAIGVIAMMNRGGQQNDIKPTSTPSPTATAEVSETVTPTVSFSPTPTDNAFENDFMKIFLFPGWTAKKNGDAVSIVNGKYILYINPNFKQASGVDGGRFNEITTGAPSVAAVVTEQPSEECGVSEKNVAFGALQRNDFYIDKTETKEYCNTPAGDSALWYFSYVNETEGYINYYANSEKGFIITMAFDTNSINQLPKKGDSTLTKMLTEMSNMLEGLDLKQAN